MPTKLLSSCYSAFHINHLNLLIISMDKRCSIAPSLHAFLVIVYRNCSKVANLKRSKHGIVHLLSSSPASLVPECEVLNMKQPPILCRKFSWDDHLNSFLNITLTCLVRFFAGKTEEAKCTNCWKTFVGACARMTHQLQVRGQLRITIFIEKKSINKNSLKHFLQRSKRCRDEATG